METARRRLVLVPFPFQGHLTPMLQLGAILHSRGFSISIAHTLLNYPDPSLYPDFMFLPLPDGVSASDVHFDNMLNVMSDLNTSCNSPFHDHLVQLQLKGEFACVIYDSIMHFAHDVANHLNIPTIVLRTNSAAFVHSSRVVLNLVAQKLIPLPESQLDDLVPGLGVSPLRFKDLPLPAAVEIPEAVQDFTREYVGTRTSSAVIWNSLDMLEHEPLAQLQQHDRIPSFPVGPFHKLAPTIPTSLAEENTQCLSWLDAQAPNSVVYVSLGSVATIDRDEFVEMAWGLAQSCLPFLWVVRDSLVSGSRGSIDDIPLPDGLLERGCVVRWAPQREVLAHAAVGGFLSHCGWNSTLESLSEGVPVVCRPCFSDQQVNARYLTRVWRVGLELEQVERGRVAQAVRMLLLGEEGKAMRERAITIKQQLELCFNRGGSSFNLLDDLIKFIVSLSLEDHEQNSTKVVMYN